MKYNLFIAVLPSHDQQKRLAQSIHRLEAKRSPNVHVDWTYERDLHVTVQFIPSVEEQHILLLAQNFTTISATPKFMCRFSQARLFGNAIVLTLEPKNSFLALNKFCTKQLGELLNGRYLPQNPKKYLPHLTIGRIKTTRRPSQKDESSLLQLVETEFSTMSFLVQQASCMQRLPEALRQTAQVYWQHKSYVLK